MPISSQVSDMLPHYHDTLISKSNKIATSKCNFAKIQMISRKEFIFRVICISASFPESIFKKDSVFY